MMATVYVANTISTDWERMSGAFNVAMLVMLPCVATLYFIQTRLGEQDAGAARNSLTILSVVCGIYLVAIIATPAGMPSA